MANKIETVNGHRIKVNGYSSAKLQARRERRQLDAEQRQAAYDKLTTAQKIQRCQRRPGDSERELSRLRKEEINA